MERVEILRDLRLGVFDVLVGVNLLREGLDLPEVALVAIIDADKEGFLRSERSLIQIIGRAARNAEGKVIMYADKITESMNKAISETNRRRAIQHEYNLKHGITPKTVFKSREAILEQASILDNRKYSFESEKDVLASEPKLSYTAKPENLDAEILRIKQEMEKAAAALDFVKAAELRDILFELKKM
jgi:excinuclease ABC subunit B